MTVKERLHKLIDELSEMEANDALKILIARLKNGNGEAEAAKPGDVIDDWGNLSAMRRASSARKLAQLDAQEAAAGFSWDEYL